MIVRLARSVPGLLSSNEIDTLAHEWLLYSIENVDPLWIFRKKFNDKEGKEHVQYQGIDPYWNKIFCIVDNRGNPKYRVLSKLVRNLIIISHGNADVERGFSVNSNILSEDRTLLSDKSINALRTTYDSVSHLVNGSVHKVNP